MKRPVLTIILGFYFMHSFAQQINNTSYSTSTNEKILRLEFEIPVDQHTAWKYFTTDSLLQKWIAPIAHIELRSGGYIITNYNKNKTLDDSSSIKLMIINYLEEQLITFKVKLNNHFPVLLQNEDKNLQEIVQFYTIGNHSTKIVSSMLGWGKGADWDKSYIFFEKGNEWTYKELIKIFR